MKYLSLLMIPALAFLAAGCATTNQTADTESGELAVVPVEPAAEDAMLVELGTPFPEKLNAVCYVSDDLVDELFVQNQEYRRTPNNTFEVVCTLKNLTGKPLHLQARTQYFDADRRHMEGPGAWQQIFLPPLGIETYTAYSYTSGPAYYYVEVMEL